MPTAHCLLPLPAVCSIKNTAAHVSSAKHHAGRISRCQQQKAPHPHYVSTHSGSTPANTHAAQNAACVNSFLPLLRQTQPPQAVPPQCQATGVRFGLAGYDSLTSSGRTLQPQQLKDLSKAPQRQGSCARTTALQSGESSTRLRSGKARQSKGQPGALGRAAHACACCAFHWRPAAATYIQGALQLHMLPCFGLLLLRPVTSPIHRKATAHLEAFHLP